MLSLLGATSRSIDDGRSRFACSYRRGSTNILGRETREINRFRLSACPSLPQFSLDGLRAIGIADVRCASDPSIASVATKRAFAPDCDNERDREVRARRLRNRRNYASLDARFARKEKGRTVIARLAKFFLSFHPSYKSQVSLFRLKPAQEYGRVVHFLAWNL